MRFNSCVSIPSCQVIHVNWFMSFPSFHAFHFISIHFFPTHHEFLQAMSLFRNFRPGACQKLPGMSFMDVFDYSTRKMMESRCLYIQTFFDRVARMLTHLWLAKSCVNLRSQWFTCFWSSKTISYGSYLLASQGCWSPRMFSHLSPWFSKDFPKLRRERQNLILHLQHFLEFFGHAPTVTRQQLGHLIRRGLQIPGGKVAVEADNKSSSSYG